MEMLVSWIFEIWIWFAIILFVTGLLTTFTMRSNGYSSKQVSNLARVTLLTLIWPLSLTILILWCIYKIVRFAIQTE